MIEVEGWVVLNFFTSFLLILLLIFQHKTSRLKNARKYSAIMICTLILLFAETIGRIGETHPDNLIMLARIGYFIIFLLDPLDILFAVYYMDCWMDEGNGKLRNFFRKCFEAFAAINVFTVTVSALLHGRWFFYFENGIYYRGTFFYVRAGFLMFFIAMLLVYAFVFRENIISEYKVTVLFLPGFALIGSILQVFLANLDSTYAGIALGGLILFFFYQNKDGNVDYLTGVYNRRGLDIKLEEMVKNSTNTSRDFYAIMMDIDNFKEINDSLGHDAGDRAIKTIADILMDIFGTEAVIGRFGGDEFCVIVGDTNQKAVDEKIMEFRGYLTKACFKNNWPKNVDVSCGVQKYEYDSGLSAFEFQSIIDRLMYIEKQEHHRYS